MKSKLPKPTDAELKILRVLWEQGPSTVRQVFTTLNRNHEGAYTTVLKFLQIMTEKGLVQRDTTNRAHVFNPTISREETQQQLLGDLLKKAFQGSAQNLVMQALSTQRTSPEERDQIRQLLDHLEE